MGRETMTSQQQLPGVARIFGTMSRIPSYVIVVARNGVILNYIYITIIYSFTMAKWLCKMTDWLMVLASRLTLPIIPISQAQRAESMRICWHLILINYSFHPILGTPSLLTAFARCSLQLGLGQDFSAFAAAPRRYCYHLTSMYLGKFCFLFH